MSLRRTRADWPILVAAAVITIVASTLLAAGPIYSAAVAEAGLHRILRVAPIEDVNIEVSTRSAPGEADDAAETVEGVLRDAVGSPVVIRSSVLTSSFALPDQPEAAVRNLATLAALDGVNEHATLVAGAWPEPAAAGAPIGLAILEPVATELGLEVSDRISLTSRLDTNLVIETVVAAIYRPIDPSAAFWWNDATLLGGITESPQYRTYGPLLATREDVLGRAGGASVRLTWHAFPVVESIAIDGVAGLRTRMEQLPTRIDEALPDAIASTKTGLPGLLEGSEQSLLVSRTGVLLLLVQLAVLAGYAIALTADLIVDHRRLDTAMLRSRGAGTRQVAGLALAEALLLAVPGALLGPWLAGAALLLFNVAGPLASIGLPIEPVITADAFLVSAVAALGCAFLIVLPAFIAARSFATERSARARPGTRPLGQRVGLDLALLAVTAIGLWQLQLYGTPLTRTVRGSIGIDPLLIAAPAIGILAGGVLALRIVPLLAQVADAVSARGRNLVGSLGARQLARRPLRYTRTAMLIMLAVAMGVFSVSYGSTWAGSQREQADHQVGADLRVKPAVGVDALDRWAVGGAYASIPGVAAVMPVALDQVRYTRTTGAGDLIAVDAALVPEVVTSTDGPAGEAVTNAAAALVAARRSVDAVTIPGSPQRIAVEVDVPIERAIRYVYQPRRDRVVQREVQPAVVERIMSLRPTVTIRDGHGLLHSFEGSTVPRVAGPQQLEIDLLAESTAGDGSSPAATPAYPIEVVDLRVELSSAADDDFEVDARLDVVGIAGNASAQGGSWRAATIGGPGGWLGGWAHELFDLRAIDEEPLRDEPTIGVDFQWQMFGSLEFSFVSATLSAARTADLAVVGNRAFLEALRAGTGDRITVQMPGGPRSLLVVGEVEAFPTTRPDRATAIVDLPSLALARYATNRAFEAADEWWLALDASASDALVHGHATGVLAGATVLSRIETRERLTTEPLALGMLGALSLGFVAAGLFAVIGLAVSATVSARQRRTEFALLRALGLSPDQLSGWIWLENASVVLVSLLAGTGLGLLIGWIVLPFITVSQGGGTPFPPVAIDVPWVSVLILEGISAVALVVTLVLLGRAVRRSGVGSVLRMGED